MENVKVLAMYLPQFHRTPENDEWWGEGFTEWTTVKAAKPLYPDHEQPRKPLEYYDLMDKEVMLKQAKYMHQYGVDGMCFYHYYFENGKKVLERPAENLLKWKDVDMPFCFCWANTPWVRSWSNVQGNSWTEVFEPENQQKTNSVLLRQNYGGKQDWEKHFYYLLPFFKDCRYLKKNGRPIFIIQKVSSIELLMEMKNCWDELMCKENLLPVMFIGMEGNSSAIEGRMIREPIDTWRNMSEQSYLNEYGFRFFLDYDDVWENILNKDCVNENTYLGGFVGYDDSPRRGYKGRVIYGSTPEKFKKYMIRLLTKAAYNKSGFVFINAWNEWGEGMYLEPDMRWGDGYLSALAEARKFFSENKNLLLEVIKDNSSSGRKEISLINKKDLYKEYCLVMDKWLKFEFSGRSIAQYLKDRSYETIAIYGLGMLGSSLVMELKKNGLPIKYGIDQDVYKGRKFDFPIYTLSDNLPEVQVIIVTITGVFDIIRKKISDKCDAKIVSIKSIVEM